MCRLGLLVVLLAIAACLGGRAPPVLAQAGVQSGMRGEPSRAATAMSPPECRTDLTPAELLANPDVLDQLLRCMLGAQPGAAADADPCGATGGPIGPGTLLDGEAPREAAPPTGAPQLDPAWKAWYANWYSVLDGCIYKKTRAQPFASWLSAHGHDGPAPDEWYCAKIGYEVSANGKLTMTGQDFYARAPWTNTTSDRYYYDFVKDNFMSMDGKAPAFPTGSEAQAVRRSVVVTVGDAPITPLFEGVRIAGYLCPNERPPAQPPPDLLY